MSATRRHATNPRTHPDWLVTPAWRPNATLRRGQPCDPSGLAASSSSIHLDPRKATARANPFWHGRVDLRIRVALDHSHSAAIANQHVRGEDCQQDLAAKAVLTRLGKWDQPDESVASRGGGSQSESARISHQASTRSTWMRMTPKSRASDTIWLDTSSAENRPPWKYISG